MKKKQEHTDIKTKHWTFSKWLKPYALVARWDRPVGIHLLLIPCLIGLLASPYAHLVHPFVLLKLSVLFFIGSLVMRGSGCTINDLWDRELDQKVTRTKNRPLASGVLSVKQALIFLFIQSAIGALILFQLPQFAIFLGFASIPLVVLYPLMKRITFWPQLFLGITFNWGLLIGFFSTSPVYTTGLVILYLSLVFWTIAYDTVYAYQDLEDDISVGIKSTARLFAHHGKKAVIVFYLLHFLFLMAGLHILGTPSHYLALVLVICTAYMTLIARKFNPQSAITCLQLFKSNVRYGYCIVFVLIFDILSPLLKPYF